MKSPRPEQANSIVEQARNGANFGKLAITYSADQQALKGGQMGWGRIRAAGHFRSGVKHGEERISSVRFVPALVSTF